MTGLPLNWRSNLRGNLILWPQVAENVRALAEADGEIYDEDALAHNMPGGAGADRAVRNTFEIMAMSGLAYKAGDPVRLRLTDLGAEIFRFLLPQDKTIANANNLPIASEFLIRALSKIVEYRTIWQLMIGCEGWLTNEELNRSMSVLGSTDDLEKVVGLVLASRDIGDPTQIGARFYEDHKYGTDAESDQRKAINPIFLLIGGGRLFLTMDDRRRLTDWAIPMIENALLNPIHLEHPSTEPVVIQAMSAVSCAPRLVSLS